MFLLDDVDVALAYVHKDVNYKIDVIVEQLEEDIMLQVAPITDEEKGKLEVDAFPRAYNYDSLL